MAKVSPLIRSFNGGEVSKLVEGRTDLERYPSSNRSLLNYVAAPQGPAIPRSGTSFVNTTFKHTKKSVLVPFVFDDDDNQMYVVEFTDQRIRFFSDEGILIYTPVAATGTGTSPFTFTSAALTALGAAVGSQIVLGGYADSYNLNGVIANITAKSGDDYTIDAVYPALTLDTTITVGLVYSITSPYAEADLDFIRDLQSLDVVYLFHKYVKPYKLKRSNTYSWAFEAIDFLDGPYMDTNDTSTTLTPSARGTHTPFMTSNTLPSGSTAAGSSNSASHEYYRAFDAGDTTSYWESNTNQIGILSYQASSAFICDGYSIHLATDNANTSYTIKDYAPSTWTFEGSNDGSTWTVIDSKVNYVLYDDNKSLFFELQNTTAYAYYRINIKACTRNGPLNPRIHNLILRSTTSKSLTITASSVTGINNGQGFLTTDIGRLIRMRGNDGTWRALKITARTSTTVVTATLLGEPFVTTDALTQWRLGHWSDTTGYPTCGVFFQDRLWLAGSNQFPDLVVGSNSQDYENMTPSDPDGTVLDTNAIVRRLNSRRLSRIKWMAESDKGLLLGTGSREWVITAIEGAGKTITPDNVKVTGASSRGSSDIDPIPIDNQVLYVQRAGRTAREFAYVYDVDGYKSPSMSLLSSHLGVYPFVQMVYAAEPYSIIWMRRSDGSVVGLTYNRDENVVGWHRHDFSGGVVESMAVIPSSDKLQDTLWLVIRRVINGAETVRYIEKLTRFWDFDMTIQNAHYVDCALRYEGDPTDVLFGLKHLEGRDDIYGLADGLPFGPKTVVNGTLTFDREASNYIIGIGFDAEGETSALENGAQDGTAQGKEKRINSIKANLWQSYGGYIGTWNEDQQQPVYDPVEYPGDASVIDTINLFSGIVGGIVLQPGYEKRGSVFFKRTKDIPLPFNLIALMPSMNTYDGG